jgi:hypothetical protein
MTKLDRLGWAAGLAFNAYGCRIGIRVSDGAVLEQVLERLPPGWKPAATPEVESLYSFVVDGAGGRAHVRRFHLVYRGIERLVRTSELDDALAVLQENLQLQVAEGARGRLFVHAGVVGWRGRAIVLPGRSFAGKSTLVAALMRAGATYYSDEYAVFDARGRVHPFARPLALRGRPGEAPGHYAADSWGRPAGRKALPVGLVVLTTYRAGGRWRPRPLTPANALLALLEHTVPVRRQPERALRTLQEVVMQATALQTVRGEAEDAAEQLLHGDLLRDASGAISLAPRRAG